MCASKIGGGQDDEQKVVSKQMVQDKKKKGISISEGNASVTGCKEMVKTNIMQHIKV